MFINPRTAIEEGWITHPDCKIYQDWLDRKFISPNAIDFTLDRLFSIRHRNSFRISEGGKEMRGGNEVNAVTDRKGNTFWRLDEQSVYDGMSDMYVIVPEGVVVLPLVVRSTFNRNGIYLTSGIYDSFFAGNLGFIIHNRSGKAFIAPGTRIGQVAFALSDNARRYEGGYNTNRGQHWSETQPST